MLMITNGTKVLTVTKGAYECMYAPQGWEITTGENEPAEKVEAPVEIPIEETPDEIPQETDEIKDEFDVDLSEIPLSEMSVPQLKMYAA